MLHTSTRNSGWVSACNQFYHGQQVCRSAVQSEQSKVHMYAVGKVTADSAANVVTKYDVALHVCTTPNLMSHAFG